MSVEVHKQMHRVLGQRQTSELLEIWQTNNQQKWSKQAIQVVGEILRERQVALPAQQQAVGEEEYETLTKEPVAEPPTHEETVGGYVFKIPETEQIKEEAESVSEAEIPPAPPPVEPYAWYKAWFYAYAHPSVGTFIEMLQDRRVSLWRAYLWVAVASLTINGFKILVHLNELLSLNAGDPSGPFPMVLGVTYALIRVAFREMLYLAVLAGIAYLVARALRGTGRYVSLVYAFAAIYAPLVVIIGLLSFLPIDWGVRVVYFYVFSLFVQAMQAVYGFGFGKALLAVFVSIVLPLFAYVGITSALP